MTRRLHAITTGVAMAFGAALLAPTAFAQTQPPTAQPPAQQAPAQQQAAAQPGATAAPDTGPTPTDAELKKFAGAATEVLSIRQATEPKLAAAKTANDRTKLQQDAEKKMEAAVRSHDLSVHRYEQIAAVVQTNTTVRDKLMKMMQKKKS